LLKQGHGPNGEAGFDGVTDSGCSKGHYDVVTLWLPFHMCYGRRCIPSSNTQSSGCNTGTVLNVEVQGEETLPVLDALRPNHL